MTDSIDDRAATEVANSEPAFKERWSKYFHGLDFLDHAIREEILRTPNAVESAGEHVRVSMSNCLKNGLVVFRGGTFEYTGAGRAEWNYFQQILTLRGYEG